MWTALKFPHDAITICIHFSGSPHDATSASICLVIAKCLSMRHILVQGDRGLLLSMHVCIYVPMYVRIYSTVVLNSRDW